MKFFIKNKIAYVACFLAIFLTACGDNSTSGKTSCKVDNNCQTTLFAIQDNLKAANEEIIKTDNYSAYRLDILANAMAEAEVVLADFIDNQLDITTTENQATIVETVALLEDALNTLAEMKPRGECGLYSCDNDYIVYFVNAGDDTTDTLEEGNKLGVYQTFTDQVYGEDLITHKSWGLVTDAVSASVRDNTTTLGTLNYYSGDQIEGKAIAYDFELPEGAYELELKFLNPWSDRAVNVYAEGMLISSENLVLGQNREVSVSYLNLEVLDGTLNIVIEGPNNVELSQQNDPLINTIIIKDYIAVAVDDLSTDITTATAEAAKTDAYNAYRITQLEAAIAVATADLNDFVDNALDASTSDNQTRLMVAIAALDDVVAMLLEPVKAIEGLTAVSAEAPIELNWVTPGLVSTDTKVYRADAASEGDTPDVDNRVEVASLTSGETTWTDDTSAPGHTYHYWVDVVDADGNTVQSEPVFAEYVLIEVLELDAVYVNNTIEVSWKLAFKDMSTIEIYRNTIDGDDGRTRVLASAPAEGTFVDNAPALSSTAAGPALPGVDYWYTIKLVLADGTRPTVPRVPATIPVGGGDPILGAYSELSAEQTEITVGWNVSSVDIASIEVFRDENEDGSTRTSVATPAASDLNWVDDTALDGVAYTYWVEVTDTDGTVYTPEPTPAVTIPLVVLEPATNLATSANGTQITVTWDLQNYSFDLDTASTFELYRNNKNSTDKRTRVVKYPATNGTFVDEGTSERPIEVGGTYWYMFKIISANGERIDTVPEAEITITAETPKEAVSTTIEPNLTTKMSGGDIEVSWDFSAYDMEGWDIQLYRNDINGTDGRDKLFNGGDAVGTLVDDGTLSNGTNEPLVIGSTYWYMFKLVKTGETTVNTDPAAEITIPAATPLLPVAEGLTTNLSTVLNGSTVEVSWDLSAYDLTGYNVQLYRDEKDTIDGGTRDKLLNGGEASTYTHTDDGTLSNGTIDPLVSGTTYWYMLKIQSATATVNTTPEASITIP